MSKGGKSTVLLGAGNEELLLSVLLQAICDHFSPDKETASRADDFIKSDGFGVYVDAIAPSADADVLREVILSGKLTAEDFKENLKKNSEEKNGNGKEESKGINVY